jgi:hypothetical protein
MMEALRETYKTQKKEFKNLETIVKEKPKLTKERKPLW